MKKLLLLTLLLVFSAHVFGQQTYSQHRVFLTNGNATIANGDVWHVTNSWVVSKEKHIGGPENIDVSVYNDPSTVQAATNFPGELKNSNPEAGVGTGIGERLIVVVRKGHTLYLRDHVRLSGSIVVEPGGKLIFNKVHGDKGRLELVDQDGTIFLRGMPASDLISNSEYDNGTASDFLMIGKQGVNLEKVNGLWINAIPSPMAYSGVAGGVLEVPVNAPFLKCLTNGTWSKDEVWTEQKLIAILKCANPNTPMPVDLLSLDAKAQGAEVKIDWSVTREHNFSHYEIEWSVDAKNFQTAGVVSAKGTGNGVQQYSFSHKPAQYGTLYYRLLAVDRDGTVADKGLRVVRVGTEVFNVYAKQGRLHINYNGPADTKVALLDTMGRLVALSSMDADGVETAGLKPGIYLVQVSNMLEKKTQRVVIH